MTLSSAFIHDLNFLSSMNPKTHSLELKNNQLILTRKRSKAANFFWHFIHLISFTLVPINPNLDRVSRHILKQSRALNCCTIIDAQEKKLLERSFTHLKFLIKNQSGCNLNKISSLIKTVKKLQTVNTSLKFLVDKFYLDKGWVNKAKMAQPTFTFESFEKEIISNDSYFLAAQYIYERKDYRSLFNNFFESFLNNKKIQFQDKLEFLEKAPTKLLFEIDLLKDDHFKLDLPILIIQALPNFSTNELFEKMHIQQSLLNSFKALFLDKKFDINELNFLLKLSLKENVFSKVIDNIYCNDVPLFIDLINQLLPQQTKFSKNTLEKIATFLFHNVEEEKLLELLKEIPYDFLKEYLIVSLHLPSNNFLLEIILFLNEDDTKDFIAHLKNQTIDSIYLNRIKEKFPNLC